MTKDGRSAAVAASGLRPFGVEPQDASQAEPLVPNAECAKCGAVPVRMIVAGEPLCGKHSMEWAHAETCAADEERICRVMRALDAVAEEKIDGPWEKHLRRMAEAVVDVL